MSFKQKRDTMILFSLIIIPVFLIATFYQHFVSHDSIFLYIGIAALLLIIYCSIFQAQGCFGVWKSTF